ERVLDDDEIRAIWLACNFTEAEAEAYVMGRRERGAPRIPDFSWVVKLLFLTGCRMREIGDLKWEEIKGRTIAIPKERTKTEAPLYLPITDMMLDILKRARRLRPNKREYVFGKDADSGFRPRSEKINSQIIKMGGTPPSAWRIHDIRRTVRTGMA